MVHLDIVDSLVQSDCLYVISQNLMLLYKGLFMDQCFVASMFYPWRAIFPPLPMFG
jgi:hypothetical protein